MQKFKSFEDTSITLKPYNILVGANNSGKSTILYAIQLFFSLMQNTFQGTPPNITFHQYFVDITEKIPLANSNELWYLHKISRKLDNGIKITVKFSSGLELQLILTSMFGQTHVAGKCLNNPSLLTGEAINELLSAKVAFISGMQGILPREAYVTPARINALARESRYIEIFRSSLLNLKNRDNHNIDRLNDVLRDFLAIEISNIQFDPNKDQYLFVEYKKGNNAFDISNAGAGMQQIIQMLTHLYLNDPDIVLIDEPDAHLHPELQSKIGLLLKKFSEEKHAQLFIATHSPEIIDSFDNKEVFLIDASRPRITAIGKDNDFVDRLFNDGILTSSSLTNLAIRPNCFVFEDEKSRYFQKIASLLDCNIFERPGRTKSAKGVSNFSHVYDIYKGVSTIINRELTLFFLQDSDGIPEQYIDFLKRKYETSSIRSVHILNRHEIENYFIEIPLIKRALNKLLDTPITDDSVILNLIRQASGKITSLQRQVKDRSIAVVHFCNEHQKPNDIEIEDEINTIFKELDLNYFQIIQKIIPGKEFFSKLHAVIDEQYHVNFSISNCLDCIEVDDINDELKDFFAKFRG